MLILDWNFLWVHGGGGVGCRRGGWGGGGVAVVVVGVEVGLPSI